MANQPAKHGRDHLPSGYAAVVQPYSDPAELLDEGSADQIRSISAGAYPWARISKGFDAANQSCGNNSFTNLTFNHSYNMASGDSGEGIFQTSGTTKLQVLVSGIYLVTTEVLWFDAVTSGWLMGPICLNPTQDWNKLDGKGSDTGTTFSGIVSTVIKLVANATVNTQVWQNSGGARNVDVFYLEMIRIGGYTGVDLASMDPDA